MISSNSMLPSKSLSLLLTLTVLCELPYQQPCFAANPMSSAPNGRRIEIKPSAPIVFFEAQSVSNKVLTCKALGDQPGLFNQLRWSGPNRMDNWDELKARHKIRERNSHSVELEFNKPTPDDSGIYYCHGTFQSSDYYNASITVKVYNPIKLENCPERQFVVENESNQKVSCRVTGDSPLLVVSKDDEVIDSSNQRYKWDEDGLKILQPAKQIDSGIYTIEVTTDLTGDRRVQHITVDVHSKPTIEQHLPAPGAISDYTGVEGTQVELKCETSGRPKPLVLWYGPRLRNLTQVGGYFVNLEQGTLMINKVNRVDDNGNFLCVAHNHVGEAKRNVSMTVLIRPEIIKFENKTVEEGQEAILECRATGHPKPTFSIRKHGINQMPYRIGDGFVTDISEDEEGGGAKVYVYRVKVRANKSNFGLHYCNATNLAGHGPESVNQLFVEYKPDLSLTPPEQYVRLGKNVTVTCHIRAYPKPNILWFNDMDQRILNAPTSFKTSPDGQTHIATMMPPNSMLSATGKYKCFAKNDPGESYIYITTKYTTKPGEVRAMIVDTTPTTVKVDLSVPNDGGDRIRSYIYRVEGITRDQYNPLVTYPRDIQNETLIEAVSATSTYTIRNLLPYYTYRITLKATNDVGDGDITVVNAETRKPTEPEAPIIIKPNIASLAQTGFVSDYQNGYVLRWSPPDLDNGDPITMYIIKINRVNPDSIDLTLDEGEQRIIEQTSERPLHAKLGPLETNRHYRIQVQARNRYGDSEPARLVIFTDPERPLMPDFGPQALTWLTEPSTPVLVCLLILAIISLIIIDVIFCFCFQIGVSHSLRNCCCRAKANSVISDKTYT